MMRVSCSSWSRVAEQTWKAVLVSGGMKALVRGIAIYHDQKKYAIRHHREMYLVAELYSRNLENGNQIEACMLSFIILFLESAAL